MQYRTGAPIASFLTTARAVLLSPASFFSSIVPRDKSEEQRMRAAIWFVVACSVVFVICAGAYEIAAAALRGEVSQISAFGLQGAGAVAVLAPTILILAPLGALIQLYVVAFLLHVPVALFAGPRRRGYYATLKVYAYMAVTLLLSWVPVVWFVVSLYQAYLATVGIRELHATTTPRAAIVGLIVLAASVLFLWLDPASVLSGGFG